MAQETKQIQAPLLCSEGCGFFGSPRTDGMCSVCYNDFLLRQNTNSRMVESVSAPESSHAQSHFDESPSPSSSTQQDSNSTLVTAEDVKKSEAASAQILSTTKNTSGGSGSAAAVDSGQGKAGGSVEESSSRGKRKLNEILQLDGESESDASMQPTAEPHKPKLRKNCCFTCHKKVGLTGFHCRCGNMFCGVHRYSDVHDCTFDYRINAAEKIRRENPVVIGEKIPKI